MPLIMISGFPSSGKTARSKQLISDFTTRITESTDPRIQKLNIVHITDESLGLSRSVYATARAEKDARATFSSAIQRALHRDTLVVADGLNYIKGFRYQLYCDAKAAQTPSCVVQIGTPASRCREFNSTALETGSGGYEQEVFENLVFRYEEPNGMARWDSPLFVVADDDELPPSEAIWDAIIGSDGKAKVVKPNAATVLKPASQGDYLYELDRTTSEVIALVTAWVKDHPGEGGGEVVVPDVKISVKLGANVPTLPQLQRLRRQFISLNRQHALGKSRTRELFVEYLNGAFE